MNRTAVCICNSLVHSPLSSLHNMIHQKGVVILCCVFLLSTAVPIREEASGAASILQHECEKDGEVYETGAQPNNTEGQCQLCYCQKGKLVCAVIQCYHRDDCEPHFVPGRCCPKYDHCPALGEKKDEILLQKTNMLEDDIKEFALGDDPSAYFAGSVANSPEEHISAEALGTDVKSESVVQSDEEQILDLSKILSDMATESSTAKSENEWKTIGESNLFVLQHKEKILGSTDDNGSKSTEDTIAERNEMIDYQNEEAKDENIQHNAGESSLSEMSQKEKELDSIDDNDNVDTEEMVIRSIVKIGYQDEHEEENQQNVEETQSSEIKESLHSKQEYGESSEVTNSERKMFAHQHEAQQDIQQNIGEQDSEMHPNKKQLTNTDSNHDESTVIEPDNQDDENEQQNVGEPDASQYEENKQNEQENYDGTTDTITTERNEQNEESVQENDQHIGKQDSSELNLNGGSLQDENYKNGATEDIITETNLNHQDEEEYKQENEQPVGEQAVFETKFEGEGNNYDTTEIIPTESYINPDHQDEHKLEKHQQDVEELHSFETALGDGNLQSQEGYDGTTEMVPVKINVKLDYQDKHDDQQNIGEPYPSETHSSVEELHYESITEVAITERNMNLDSHSEENQLEKKQQDKGKDLSETQENKKQEDSKEKMGNALEISEAMSTEKNQVARTNTTIVSSHDVITELPYTAKQAEANGESIENDYAIYTSEIIEGPKAAHYVKINNEKQLNNKEHEVYNEATTEDTDALSKLNKNNTNESTSREEESNDWSKLSNTEEGSGSNRFDDCAGGKEECAFLVKEWKILMPQLAMAPTPSPFNFWEYYDYSSSEVRPVSYNDPEEVLVLLPHPPQNDQNVAESLENTAEFAMQHKVQDTNHIL